MQPEGSVKQFSVGEWHLPAALEEAQGSGGNVTGWLVWFLGCVERAIGLAETEVQLALRKARFWRRIQAHELNQRQAEGPKVVNRLLDASPGGFEGGLTNRKYRQMTRASERTALRDIGSPQPGDLGPG